MKILKKISVWILIFILNFNIVPVYAQENIDLEDLDMDQVYTSQGEIGQYIIDDTPAKLEEMREILRNKANKYHISEGTFRDKVSALNMSALPPVNKDETFKKSKFFKEKGSLFRFMLEQKLAVLDELFLQGDWHAGDYSNTAVRIVGDLMMLQNKDDVLRQITFASERNVLSDASYLISYVRQNKEFYDVMKDAKATAAECRANGYIDKECEEAYEYEQYDSSLLQKSNNRIKTITKYVSQQIDLCLSRVLVPLQPFDVGFEDPEIVLSEKKDVLSLAGLCGVDSNELITLLTENTITKEDAYAKASEVVNPTKFWGKLLHKLDYITPSYYLRKYKTIDDYKSTYYDDEEYEDIDNDEAYKKALASMYLTNSLNQSIAQKAANMITYGKLFYYDNEKLGSIKDRKTGKSKDVADGFAEGWHKIATHQFYKDTPAAKLAQEAILNSGRREYQDDSFTKAISEVRFLDNAKKDSEFILFAMDFIDPMMAIAPLAGSKKAATLIDKAVTTAKNTKVGRATENVLRPVTQVVGKLGDDITEAMGKGMGVKGYGGNHFGMVGDAANAGKRVGQGADAVTDATRVVNQADNVGDATKGAKEVTAMNPETVNKSLTGGVDNLVDIAGKNKLRSNIANVDIPKQYKSELETITNNMDNALTNASLTSTQRQEVEQAVEYFNSLTPDQLKNEKLYRSDIFRKNASILSSPTATEHAFFIDADVGGSNWMTSKSMEEGYIPHMLSGEENLPIEQLKKMFASAAKTDKPIFVRLEVHGEIDSAGKFYFIFGEAKSKNVLYSSDFVDYLQSLRKTTGTPEINLYSGACHSGQFLDDFMKLPKSKREGINIFAIAGSPLQVNSTGNINIARARGVKSTIKEDQLNNLIDVVIGEHGNVFSRAYVDGEIFDPLSQALLRSQKDKKYMDLTGRLETLNRLHKTTDGKEVKGIFLDYMFDHNGNFQRSLFITDGFDTEVRAAGLEDDIIDFVKDTAREMSKGKRW